MVKRRIIVLGGGVLLGLGALAYGLDRPAGYGTVVDFRGVIGPPPAAGSREASTERAGYTSAAAGIDSPRWQQARGEVFPTSQSVTDEIGCAIGRQISATATPATVRLLANVAADVRAPFNAAKRFYKRDRPYVGQADTRTCDPRTLGSLGGGGGVLSYAYPSGHAAYGEIWARSMAAAVPQRAAAVAAWGQRLGDNRIVCRVHWPSDVTAGRKLADAVYDRIAAKPAFKADLAAASAELSKSPAAKRCKAKLP